MNNLLKDKRTIIELVILVVSFLIVNKTKDFSSFNNGGYMTLLRGIMIVGAIHLGLLIYDIIKAIKNKFQMIYIIRIVMDIVIFLVCVILPSVNLNTHIYGPNWYK